VKLPVPDPSDVESSAVVGFGEVDQQTPRAVTGAPPSLVTLPPPLAVFDPIAVTGEVVTVGMLVLVVVNGMSAP